MYITGYAKSGNPSQLIVLLYNSRFSCNVPLLLKRHLSGKCCRLFNAHQVATTYNYIHLLRPSAFRVADNLDTISLFRVLTRWFVKRKQLAAFEFLWNVSIYQKYITWRIHLSMAWRRAVFRKLSIFRTEISQGKKRKSSQSSRLLGFDIKPTFFKCSTTLTVTFTLSKKNCPKLL